MISYQLLFVNQKLINDDLRLNVHSKNLRLNVLRLTSRLEGKRTLHVRFRVLKL